MHILKVRPCSEFKARDELHRLGMTAYVPVEFSTSKFGRGRETIRKAPVVRGYVFAAVNDWTVVRAVREVTGALIINDRPATLTPTQSAALELLSRPLERANSHGWNPGDRVRVRRGAFAELDAIVSQIKRGHVIATVEMMGKTHTVKIAMDQMEAA